ncbi:MAG TPA: dihydrolipoamide acetyltransferase family protein [Clostridia bacterium]|nr:dihydrolipoamide acetyltransferase family protein [Clostridia bacterium]
MAQPLVMPKLGLTMTEGTVSRWLKAQGDSVSAGEGIYEVETDKLTNTIESTVDGTLLKILVAEGATAPCLEPVAIVGAPGEDIAALLNSGSVAAPVAQNQTPTAQAPAAAQAATANTSGRLLASPATKKLAKEKGIELSVVSGTGPDGRITLEDVEHYLATPHQPTQPEVKATPLAAKIADDKGIALTQVPADGRVMSKDVYAYLSAATTGIREEIIPMTAMRRVIAKRMSLSMSTSPTVTYDVSIDMTAMKDYKAQLASENVKVSYTDLLVKIVSRVLLEFPLLNCSVDGNNLILKHYVNMGVAVALDDGLLVPVVKDAHLKGAIEISGEIKSLADQAKKGTLSPDALTGGTFTITNLGMFGVESFSPIINQPEVAILGVNAIAETYVPVNGQPVAKPLMKLSLTADHRAVDGSVAAQFLARIKKLMEKPALLLA